MKGVREVVNYNRSQQVVHIKSRWVGPRLNFLADVSKEREGRGSNRIAYGSGLVYDPSKPDAISVRGFDQIQRT